MKKILMIVLAVMFIVSGCSSKKTSLTLSSEDIMAKIDADESFVFYIGSTTCSACIAYKPVVKEMNANYDVSLFTYLFDEDKNEESKTQLLEFVSLQATPTTIVIEEGEIKKSYTGLMEYTELKKFLVNNDVLVEE